MEDDPDCQRNLSIARPAGLAPGIDMRRSGDRPFPGHAAVARDLLLGESFAGMLHALQPKECQPDSGETRLAAC